MAQQPPSPAQESTDHVVQSTFESNPRKSVADFPDCGGPLVAPTSAATSELEAKLRQRMLKCEGSDVLYRPQSAKSREKSAGRTPSRLKQSILRQAHHLSSQDAAKVDELVETASYQRCTKARAGSGPSSLKGENKNVGGLGTLNFAGAPESLDEQPATPQSGDGSTAGMSFYGSVHSQDEFFEAGEIGCTTFALDDPLRDAMEEVDDDITSPRMLANAKEAGQTDSGPEISVEECLFDLVNHIPGHLAQKIGLILHHLEEMKRSGVSLPLQALETNQHDCLADSAEREQQRQLLEREQQREQQRQEQQRRHQEQLRQCQESIGRAEELLEQQLQSELASGQLRSSSLRQELTEACGEEESGKLAEEQSMREAEKATRKDDLQRLKLQAVRVALAGADSRLLEAESQLQQREQQRDQLRAEVLCQETELVTLREALLGAADGLRRSERQEGQSLARVVAAAEGQKQLETQLLAARRLTEQTQQKLRAAQPWWQVSHAEGWGEMEKAEGALEMELDHLRRRHRETHERLAGSELMQKRLLQELAKGESQRADLEREVGTLTSKEENLQQALRLQILSTRSAAEVQLPAQQAEIASLRGEMEAFQDVRRQVCALAWELNEERAHLLVARRDVQAYNKLMQRRHSEDAMTMTGAEDLQKLLWREQENLERGLGQAELLAAERLTAVEETNQCSLQLVRFQAELEEERLQCSELLRTNCLLRDEARRHSREAARQRGRPWGNPHACQEGPAAPKIGRRSEALKRTGYLEEVLEARQVGKSLAEKEEIRLLEYYSTRAGSEMAEHQRLQKELQADRLKLQDESNRRICLEKAVQSLRREREDIASEYAVAVSELGPLLEEEAQLDFQVSALRRHLVQEQQELADELRQEWRLAAEAQEAKARNERLEVHLKGEVREDQDAPAQPQESSETLSRLQQATRLLEQQKEPPNTSVSWASPPRHPEVELAELDDVWRSAHEECVAQAKALRRYEHIQQLLTLETRSAVRETEELRFTADAKAAGESEFLKEAETRKHQLEAETSLMAWEVANLTKNLLNDGLRGLTRRPFTIQDLLKEAWQSGALGQDRLESCGRMALLEERRRSNRTQDAYWISLYLRWLRRGTPLDRHVHLRHRPLLLEHGPHVHPPNPLSPPKGLRDVHSPALLGKEHSACARESDAAWHAV